MQQQPLKFVIIGHVDHGKSTLIGRLLYDANSLPPDKIEEIKKISRNLGKKTEFAYLLDHLEEERSQGITIDTTQVFFRTDKREYVIIDAPGHREFVKNMLTGTTQAEAAVLIIDAQEGIQEQTRRHCTIISLLGLDQVFVVINKMDLVNFNHEIYLNLKNGTKDLLQNFGIAAGQYIPISALDGENIVRDSSYMAWYGGPTLLASLDLLKSKETTERQSLIFPVQDIYKFDHQRIAVGRIEKGKIEVGCKIRVLPEQKTTTIKSIEKFLEQAKSCSAGESVGVTTKEALFLERGDVLCDMVSTLQINDRFQANIFWMSKGDCAVEDKITLRCCTQEVSCKIEQIHRRLDSSTLEIIEENASKLKNLEIGEVSIKTKKPIVAQVFKEIPEIGRFVLEKNGHILAGGIITKIVKSN